ALTVVIALDPLRNDGRVRDPTIHSRGEATVRLTQTGEQLVHRSTERPGDLIAQILVAPVPEIPRRRVAVRDLDGTVREPESFDEGARRHEDHVGVVGDAEPPRGARVEREQHARQTTADPELRQLTGATVPARDIAV